MVAHSRRSGAVGLEPEVGILGAAVPRIPVCPAARLLTCHKHTHSRPAARVTGRIRCRGAHLLVAKVGSNFSAVLSGNDGGVSSHCTCCDL
uniref:Uncharacterized protein n=1 Tax=Knipowitschia caucasica TaxID=637954 RepID=A0AAV2LA34_KNICA